MISRREFLKNSLTFTAGAALTGLSGSLFGASSNRLTILYTNDTHARLDPFPNHAVEHAGFGGIAKRANLVKQIRKTEKNTLLLDAGDVFQGTPWFDVYGGEVDLKLMSQMGYDAMAVGNHEFDNGLNEFAESAKHANFPILAANYSVLNTPLQSTVGRFVVKELSGYRVGIFGLGIGLDGVVDPALYGSVQSRDPYVWAEGMVNSLRRYHRCDFIICLSHLGFEYADDKRASDLKLAASTSGVDLIIGGHTHTFLDSPVTVLNPENKNSYVTQMGHSGVRLGRIDIDIDRFEENRQIASNYYTIGEGAT